MRIYLSGPIEYAEDNGVSWRNETKEKLSEFGSLFEVIDPCDTSLDLLLFYGVESVDAYHRLKYGSEEEQGLFRACTQAFIEHDLEEVRKADVLLTKISHVASGGTSGEITLAYFMRIPVVAFCTDNIQEVSGWVQSIPDLLLIGPDSLAEAINHLTNEEVLNGFINRHRS